MQLPCTLEPDLDTVIRRIPSTTIHNARSRLTRIDREDPGTTPRLAPLNLTAPQPDRILQTFYWFQQFAIMGEMQRSSNSVAAPRIVPGTCTHGLRAEDCQSRDEHGPRLRLVHDEPEPTWRSSDFQSYREHTIESSNTEMSDGTTANGTAIANEDNGSSSGPRRSHPPESSPVLDAGLCVAPEDAEEL